METIKSLERSWKLSNTLHMAITCASGDFEKKKNNRKVEILYAICHKKVWIYLEIGTATN